MTDDEIDAARLRGKEARSAEPRATSVDYDRDLDRIVLALENGCTVSIPRAKLQGLEGATQAQIEEVEIQAKGYGLHWESLDVDLSVPGLLADLHLS